MVILHSVEYQYNQAITHTSCVHVSPSFPIPRRHTFTPELLTMFLNHLPPPAADALALNPYFLAKLDLASVGESGSKNDTSCIVGSSKGSKPISLAALDW